MKDTISKLHEELEGSKEKISGMEKELIEVDYNAKKNLEELGDRMQVERCVMEMVSWVSEQVQNDLHAQMVNDATKSVGSPKKEEQREEEKKEGDDEA